MAQRTDNAQNRKHAVKLSLSHSASMKLAFFSEVTSRQAGPKKTTLTDNWSRYFTVPMPFMSPRRQHKTLTLVESDLPLWRPNKAFCCIHHSRSSQCSSVVQTTPKLLLPIGISTPSNTWFLKSTSVIPQRPFQSVQPFFHSTSVWPTHMQLNNHISCTICSNRPHLMHWVYVMRPNKSNWRVSCSHQTQEWCGDVHVTVSVCLSIWLSVIEAGHGILWLQDSLDEQTNEHTDSHKINSQTENLLAKPKTFRIALNVSQKGHMK